MKTGCALSVRVLLADTTLWRRVGHKLSKGGGGGVETTIGTPQGDCLSPVLFIVYLEAALQDLRITQMVGQSPYLIMTCHWN